MTIADVSRHTWSAFRRRRRLAALLAAWLLAGCAAIVPDGAIVVREAALILESGSVPPDDSLPGWQPVSLPDVWDVDRRRATVEGWYRALVDIDVPAVDLWAVYLPLPGLNLAVYVNHHLVGDGGRFEPPVAHNWSRPLLFTVPARLLVGGRNTVHVRLRTDASSPAVLGPLVLGPHQRLAPVFARRHLVQVTLPLLLVAVSLAGGLLSAGVYLRRDRTGAWRWFVAGLLVWAYAATQVYTRDTRLPSHLFAWSGAVAQNGFLLCFVVAWHRLLRLARARLELVLWTLAVAGAASLLLVDPLVLRLAMLPWFASGLGLGVYALVLAVGAARRFSGRRSLLLLVPGVLGLGIGLHDVASQYAMRLWAGTLLAPWVAPLVVLATSWLVVSQLSEELAESAQLNRELERRVGEKHTELQRNYERLRELERAQAVAAERERIMQDVHDGMGGQLVSALALVESGRVTPEGIAEALRDALDDLRIVIESLEPTEDDLPTLLAIVRSRLEPRLTRHGLSFDWQVKDLPAISGLGPERALHVLRIVQEAFTNIVKHASASTIRVSTGTLVGPGGIAGVFVEVRDDGRGMIVGDKRGRGLSNMARRAAALEGQIVVDSGSWGTAIRLWLPLG